MVTMLVGPVLGGMLSGLPMNTMRPVCGSPESDPTLPSVCKSVSGHSRKRRSRNSCSVRTAELRVTGNKGHERALLRGHGTPVCDRDTCDGGYVVTVRVLEVVRWVLLCQSQPDGTHTHRRIVERFSWDGAEWRRRQVFVKARERLTGPIEIDQTAVVPCRRGCT